MPAAILTPQNTASRRAVIPVVRAGYARISIEEARTGGTSITRQVEGMRRLDPDMRIFEDDGVSGTKTSRPGFDALLRYVREESVTELVVARLDRLGRNHELKTLLPDLFHKQGCRIVCTEEESPDLSTDIGRLVFDIKCNLSCLESDRIGRRVQAGRAVNFYKAKHDGARAGYLCIDGRLVPDDQPRHCPLAQRREVSGSLDQWGIALDAWVGLSNFEIAALPVKYALQARSWQAGADFAHKYFALTRSGSWSNERGRYIEHQGKCEIEELLIINGEPVKAKRLLQSLNVGNRSSIRQRANNPVFYGHYHARRNWDPEVRPSLNQKRKGYGFIDSDTYEFFVKNTHIPMLSQEDYELTAEMNNAVRSDIQRGLRPQNPGGWRLNTEGLSEGVIQTRLLLRSVARRCRCTSCGKRLHGALVGQQRKFYYLKCMNPECTHNRASGRLDAVLGGIALQLAEVSRRIQGGELPPLKSRPTELAAIRELEDAREGLIAVLQRKPDNRVLRNQLKKLEDDIAHLKAGGAAAPAMDALKAHERFRHPRAQEPGAWLELLQASPSMAEHVLSPILWINIHWVKPEVSVPVRGVKPKWAPEVAGFDFLKEA